MRFNDLTGQRFGRLTALNREPSKNSITMWRCRCDCGNELIVRNDSLCSGKSKSCGCLKRERTVERNYRHGDSHSRLYNVWRGMKQRCSDPKHISYCYYGERGITVCEEWQDFAAFHDWALANGYDEDAPRGRCTLDRIDVNGNYGPENCRWVSMKIQQNNHQKRRTK